MKLIGLTRASSSLRDLNLILLMLLAACWPRFSPGQVIDSTLRLGIVRSNQNVVVGWFGSNGLPYQVESSTTLTSWTNASLVVTGKGALMFTTNAIAPQSRAFFRVKKIVPQIITAQFDPTTGVLTIIGDDFNNVIVVSRDASGALRVNNGAIPIQGGVATIANTATIQVFGRGGNDQITFDESMGALPKGQLFGEEGNDILIGGSGPDIINGGPGNDTILGKGGNDTLIGGEGDDTITGGDADDTIQLGPGNDRSIWNPGDDTDVIEGGDGVDTVEINGGNGAEVFTVTANGTRVRFDRLEPAPFNLDIGTCEKLVLNANGGNDSFSATGNLAALIQITVDGGPGDDTILGSNGNDVLIGGDGNDFIDGNQGNDTIFLGPGNDTFQWDPGDGLDTIEGQGDSDTVIFNGSAGAEMITLSANGARLRLTRDLGNIVLDMAGIETVRCFAGGASDLITVNDLSSTELTSLEFQLAPTLGGTTGDLAVDTVVVYGTAGADNISLLQSGNTMTVIGLKAMITVLNADTNDVLRINGEGGNDTLNASAVSTLMALTLDGGPGEDVLIGSSHADTLLGGDGADTITGRQGDDNVFGGEGDDTLVWNPGDGNDVLEGQGGSDRLLFNGANIAERFDLFANGSRFRFTRDIASIVLDGNGVEKVQVNALGGADSMSIGDLTGTGVNGVSVNLSGPDGLADGLTDTVTLNGTQTNDTIMVTGSAGVVAASGLAATLTISGTDPGDNLIINALAEADVVNASGLAAGIVTLTINGGLGNDILTGSQGADVISGGDGDDRIAGGAGNDTFIWNPGDDNDIFEGEAGFDTLIFNGANIAETFDFSANGPRLRVTRNIASVVLDCAGVEEVRVNALGGADVITVNSLLGTDVSAITAALGATLNSTTGDGASDTVIINGTAANDNIVVAGSVSGVLVSGLSTSVTITGSEAANDRLTVKALEGDDVIDASGLAAGGIGFVGEGGIDDDVLVGSAGNDSLFGGDGDDVLLGGPGIDVLDGGPGNNVLIQD